MAAPTSITVAGVVQGQGAPRQAGRREAAGKRAGPAADNAALAWAVARFVLVSYGMLLANELADSRALFLARPHWAAPPLPDLLFDLLPGRRPAAWAADAIVLGSLALFVARALTLRIGRSRRKHLIALFLNAYTLLLGVRISTVFVTTLPPPDPECKLHPPRLLQRFLLKPLFELASPDGMRSSCADCIPSGHTIFLTLSALFVHATSSPAARGGGAPWKLAAWSLAVAGYLALSVARLHYTVDIVLALILTGLVFERTYTELRQLVDP